jgi:hypothetical protein
MALSASRLADAFKAALIACNGGPAADDAKLTCYCNAMATEIVKEITENAEVLPGSFKDGMNQPVTGIGEIT